MIVFSSAVSVHERYLNGLPIRLVKDSRTFKRLVVRCLVNGIWVHGIEFDLVSHAIELKFPNVNHFLVNPLISYRVEISTKYENVYFYFVSCFIYSLLLLFATTTTIHRYFQSYFLYRFYFVAFNASLCQKWNLCSPLPSNEIIKSTCTHREDNRGNTNLKLCNGSKIVQKSRQHSTRILIVESMLSLTIVNRVAVASGGKGSVDVNAAIEDARAAEVMRQLRQGSLLWLQTHQYNWMPLYRPSTCF